MSSGGSGGHELLVSLLRGGPLDQTEICAIVVLSEDCLQTLQQSIFTCLSNKYHHFFDLLRSKLGLQDIQYRPALL